MEFAYKQRETDIGMLHVPTLPISINGFPIEQAMIDTGADVTVLPMELHQVLGVDLDYENALPMSSAGGGTFKAIPSLKKLYYSIDKSGFRSITWQGKAFFSVGQSVILLGHYECLSELVITLDGKRKKIRVEEK